MIDADNDVDVDADRDVEALGVKELLLVAIVEPLIDALIERVGDNEGVGKAEALASVEGVSPNPPPPLLPPYVHVGVGT